MKTKFTYNFAVIHGKVPMIEFLDSLAAKERAKIFAYIEKLVELKSSGISPKKIYQNIWMTAYLNCE